MEVRTTEALSPVTAFRPPPPPFTVAANANTETPQAELSVSDAEKNAPTLDYKTTEDLMEKTAELLAMLDRKLKYEVKADAGLVQLQVIDNRDGRVLRKIPADEIVKFIEHMRAQIDDCVDFWA